MSEFPKTMWCAQFRTILPVLVLRETPRRLLVRLSNGEEAYREPETDWYAYKDSYAEAKRWLVKHAEAQKKDALEALERANQRLAEIERLKEPQQ